MDNSNNNKSPTIDNYWVKSGVVNNNCINMLQVRHIVVHSFVYTKSFPADARYKIISVLVTNGSNVNSNRSPAYCLYIRQSQV